MEMRAPKGSQAMYHSHGHHSIDNLDMLSDSDDGEQYGNYSQSAHDDELAPAALS